MNITKGREHIMNCWADDWALDQNARKKVIERLRALPEPEKSNEIIRHQVRRVGQEVNNSKLAKYRRMDGDRYHELTMRHGISPYPDTQRARQERWYLQREAAEEEIG